MRSKQQPRPSFRRLKDENEEGDERNENSDNKDDTQQQQQHRSNSNSPTIQSLSNNSTENTTSGHPQQQNNIDDHSPGLPNTIIGESSSQYKEPQITNIDGQTTDDIEIYKKHNNDNEKSLQTETTTASTQSLAQLSLLRTADEDSCDENDTEHQSPSASPPLPPRRIITLSNNSNNNSSLIKSTSSKVVKTSTTKIQKSTTETIKQQQQHRISLNSHTEYYQQKSEILPPPAILLRPSSQHQRNTRSSTQRIINMLDHSSKNTSYSIASNVPTISSGSALRPTTISSSSVRISNNLIDSHDDDDASCSTNTSHHDPSTERELASPRCQSRESSGSGGRCQSDDSNCSGNGSTTAPTPNSPVGIALPATLQPAAAAALLPPQSAAMAAYLNVAAAAAQQNRLLLGNPLAAAASLAHQAAQSPPNLPLQSHHMDDSSSILDFSTKRMRRDSDTDSKSDSDAVNLSKSDNIGSTSENSPLDLSVGGRKRSSIDHDLIQMQRKISRHQEYKPVPSPWVTPMTPYLAAVAAASLSPKNHLPVDWNGNKNKMTATNDATKALEKMSEMTRLGGNTDNDIPLRPSNNQSNNSNNSVGSGGGGRHSAWQSHWLNKGADAAKDVFKCVWCKQSFPTLATLTTHMKETQHCGVNVPPSSNLPSQQSGGQQSHHHHHHHQSQSSTSSSNTSSNKSDLNLLIKETMPLPRKLVRGQDVWLGKGAEQTRQILKCMWCGQSFRSLAEMTSHMQQTQHYTNIISQEQIISWKSSEEGKGGSGGGGSGGNTGNANNNSGANSNSNSNTNSTVSAVLTCKVCDQAFSSLKDLSNHMVKNAHYKEHIMRSITESGGRRRQTREKRKKSLPVRKLLELERAQHDFKNGDIKSMRNSGPGDLGPSTRITCEKCGDKIETALFVEHIRQCVGGTIPNSPRNSIMKTPLSVANSIIQPDSMSPLTPNSRDGRKSIGDESQSPASNRHISPHTNDLTSPTSSKDGGGGGGTGEKSSPSVLNAIEQLIEKSFDTRSRHSNSGFSANSHVSAPLGSSILKRLGIDESVDYTKPLIDPQTMNLLRSYQNSQYPKRERSGSESSSVSDRGSSRLESLTPERKPDMLNHNISPRQTPEKLSNYLHHNSEHDDDKESIKVKREPLDNDDDNDADGSDNDSEIHDKLNQQQQQQQKIKKEPNHPDDKETECGGELDLSSKRKSITPSSSSAPSPHHQYPITTQTGAISTPAGSPAGSDRSTTPRSINSEKKLNSGSSLNALSSMFNNLSGTINSMSNINSDTDNGGHLTGNNSGGIGGGNGNNTNKKVSSHPLAALQKLCDKTENNPPSHQRSGNSTGTLQSNIQSSGNTVSGNMLAFSWACNDAVMTSDSIIKCAFCDTPFCSKGAYRHHLSKVHFVKDDSIDNTSIAGGGSGIGTSMKSPSERAPSAEGNRAGSSSSSSSSTTSSSNSHHHHNHQRQQQQQRPHSRSQSPARAYAPNNSSNNQQQQQQQQQPGSSTSAAFAKSPSPSQPSSTGSNQSQQPATAQSPFDESPHSKFLKYTELAKQLSSKYV